MPTLLPHTAHRLAAAATVSRRALAGLAIGAIGALAAAGLYTEAMRAPDQP
jgi:enterochelin esterase-like enzyme